MTKEESDEIYNAIRRICEEQKVIAVEKFKEDVDTKLRNAFYEDIASKYRRGQE